MLSQKTINVIGVLGIASSNNNTQKEACKMENINNDNTRSVEILTEMFDAAKAIAILNDNC